MVAFFLLFLVGTLEAQQRGVRVGLSGQELFETEPTNVISTTFVVTNTSDEELEFISDVKLPEGWRLITPAFPFRLAPKATEIRVVSFFIPQTALADKYEITYRVKSIRYPSISSITRVFVAVLSVTKLQAKLLEIPEHVIAGDDYEARFLVINESNTVRAVIIKVQSSQELPYTVEPEKFKLVPGESRKVKVSVKTDEKIRKDFKHSLRLTVQSVEDEKLKSQAKSAVNIVPRITGDTDRFHRIPGYITLGAASQRVEDKETMVQGELSGKGPLEEEGDGQIDYLFRGPDTLEESSIFGMHDRYFIDYFKKSRGLRIGDHYYSLSHLTEQSIDGRGIDGRLSAGDFEFSAYCMQTRQLEREKKETAFQLEYLFSDRHRVGLNLFNNKKDIEDDQIASLQGDFEPFEEIRIEFEAAYGQDDNGHDNAYWLNLYGSPDWGGSYRLEYIYAEPDFPGYYQDKAYVSGNFYFPIKKDFTLNATLRQEKNNLDLDPSRESAALSRYGQIGLTYRFKSSTTLSVESRYRTREDRLAEPDFDDDELTFKVRLGQSFRSLSVNVSAERGEIKERLKDQVSDVGIYEGSFYFMPTHNQSYSCYTRYSTYKDFENGGQDTMNIGLTGSFKIAQRSNCRFKLDRYNSLGTNLGDRYNADLSLSYQLANKSKLSTQGRHTFYDDNSDQENETAIIINYIIPFGLPVGRKQNVGLLDGYVHDQETGQPIANVILRLNDATAVTDSDGEFSFPAMNPGTFYLNVDSASIGLERITVQKVPLEVSIEGGEEELVNIEIIKSADFTGKIIVYEFAKEDGLQKGYNISKGEKKEVVEEGKGKMVESRGLANTLLEFKGNVDTWRVLTDRKGRFRFDNVRPGQWTLTVSADNLPEYHYLERDVFEVELTPGEEKEMMIRALPRKRTIQIIEQNEILIEEERFQD